MSDAMLSVIEPGRGRANGDKPASAGTGQRRGKAANAKTAGLGSIYAAEPIIDWKDDQSRLRLHLCGVRSYLAGNILIWRACFSAAHIVGGYVRDATRAFATDIGRSVDTVENMAHAADLYLTLQREFSKYKRMRYLLPSLSRIRRRLYYSHFAEMWSIWRAKPEMSPLDIYNELLTAADNGTSTRQLGAEAGGAAGVTAVTLRAYTIDGEDFRQIYLDPPDGARVVVLIGAEWRGVYECKVKPA